MSKEAKLVIEARSQLGTAACRRLRWGGEVPGNLYGHNAPTAAIKAKAEAIRSVVTGGSKVFDVEFGTRNDKAIIRELQWDPFGTEITHFDLFCVDPNERVTIDVPVELKGTAAGTLSGGILEQPIHKLSIDCQAHLIPDSIQVRIGGLQVGQAIHVKDLELPEGIHARLPGDTVVVHVIQVQVKDVPAAEMGAAEPEVIGKKPAEGADAAKDAGKKK